MASAPLAVLPLAHRRLLEHTDVLGTRGDLDGFGLPEREGVDRST